jgi:hypothetical protein
MSDTVVVTESSVTVLTVGVQGPPGSSNGEFLGGYNVILSNLLNSDVLSFDAATETWKNRALQELTDGGNF